METETFGQRAGKAFKRSVVTGVVLALAAAVVFLLSQLNARTFTLAELDGRLTVMKGRTMPVGVEPYQPGDGALADTYSPIALDGADVARLTSLRFNERDELDRALFGFIEAQARPRLTSDDTHELERGLYLLRRAEKLSGISEDQRISLRAMRAEVSFYQARMRLDEARKGITDALAQLKLAAESNNSNSRAAHQMILEVEPAARGLEEALRKAVHSLSAPSAPAAPGPQPTSSPDAGVDGG